ncbi:MAG: YccF domain-containing protein [Stackebrandtia sp.]
MKTLLNVIWLVLSGFWLAVAYVAAGIVCFVLIVTIPFGVASFRIAGYALWPFGREVVVAANSGLLTALGNVIWFVVAGLWIAIAHVLSGIALCVTIIGIPLGVANFKMVPVSLMPLGAKIVPSS